MGLALLLSGCTAAPVKKITVDADSLVGKQIITNLACSYHLIEVTDARAAGDRAGGLGLNMLLLQDPVGMVKDQLLKAGMKPESSMEGRGVSIRIMHMYVTQTLVTKIPVVVYEVKLENSAPWLVRAQPATMNWNGSGNEAHAGFSKALQLANNQMVDSLNAKCAVVSR
jgi:hypothetical protein